MIVMAVLSIAIAVIFYAFTASMRIFTDEMSESGSSIEMHRAMERMTRELRESRQITSANSTSITFWYQDLNGNGTRDANETVKYTWTGTTEGYVNRTVQSSTLEVASGIRGFTLTYNDPAPANIKLIKIFITALNGKSVSTLESSVKSRNL